MSGRERRLAVRVLNALLREDYAGIASRLTHDKDGVALVLASGRRVRLAPGAPFQDFAVAEKPTGGGLGLAEVLGTLEAIADPADARGVAAFVMECRETLAALELHHLHRAEVLARLLREERSRSFDPDQATDVCRPDQSPNTFHPDQPPNAFHPDQPPDSVPPGAQGRARRGAGGARSLIFYETLAAGVDHPIYPTARCRLGISADDLVAHAPEFAPRLELAWVAVPREGVILADPGRPSWWPEPGDIGLSPRLAETHMLFPVHPLTMPKVADMPGVIVARKPYMTVRPTLSMRTVEIDDRTHLKLPLATSTLGLRNRRSIKPGTLRDGALAESLLRQVLAREPGMRVSPADEQAYGHAGHEYLGWMVRGLPEGEIVSVAALLAGLPLPNGMPSRNGKRNRRPRLVLHDLAERFYGDDVRALLRDYLATLFGWNVMLFVRYGIALEAHQQNLSLVFGGGPMRLLVKDNDGLLVSPDRLRAAGLDVPDFGDERMLTDDPHALADVFVTITLHLAAMAVAQGALPDAAGGLVREALSAALEPYGDDPMARLLRARTFDAARLVGKSMVVAGTLVDKDRTGARDINKFYGTTGPNYLRQNRS